MGRFLPRTTRTNTNGNGVSMVKWEEKKIEDCADFFNGLAHEHIINRHGKYILVTSKCIATEEKSVRYVSQQLYPLFVNDITMVMSDIPNGRALAKCMFIRKNGTYTLNQRICVFRNHKIDSTFLFYILNRNKCFLDFNDGYNQTNLRKVDILNCIIKIPPLPEQRRIATVLSDTDELITALEKLIAKKCNIKQGAMQELLTGKRRLPGFSGKWVEKKLDELLEYEQPTSYIVNNAKYSDSGIPVLTAGKSLVLGYTNENTGIYDNLPVIIFDDFTTESKFITYRFKVKSSAMKFLTSAGKSDIRLVYSLMQMIDFPLKDHKRYWISDYSKLYVKIPQDITEQTAIASILSDMDAEIDALTAKLNKLKHIKQGMMSELLTGRIRILEQKIAVEPATVVMPLKPKKAVKKNTIKKIASEGHNDAIEDAVILAVVTEVFATEKFPLTPFYAQKLPYLIHRHIKGVAKGYTKKAAGPYNPSLKYKTALPIALANKYVIGKKAEYKGVHYTSLLAGTKAAEAKAYFIKWHGNEPIQWLEQFHYIKNRRDELELLATVDMAICDLRDDNQTITVQNVKNIIQNSKDWKAKLKREIFSDENISRTIKWSNNLFGQEEKS